MMSYSATNQSGYDSDADKAAKTVRNAAKAVGAVFLLVGILGFIPGITSNIYPIDFAGHEGNAKLLGLFEVSILHNVVHLIFGAAGLGMAKNAKSATSYLIGGGVIYLVLALFGVLIGHDTGANFVPLNDADNVLHLLLGLGMVGLGLIGRRATKSDSVGAGAQR
jgi:hypothetical protein